MQSLLGLTHKSAKDLVPGELFRFALNSGSSSSLALMLGAGGDGDPLYGILASPEFKTPLTWYEGSSTDRCISYGTKWLLEERPGPETAPGNAFQQDAQMRLFIDNGGTIIRFAPPQGFVHQSINFDLTNGKSGMQLSARAAPVANWAIWAGLDQYKSARTEALFEYPPKAA
ncbi:hypothetical protein NKI77_11855 [Mesorhizobium opportunistum]|uniref:Uncharacterized protein n=1 Tax=Mesorhizobium opportunistum TaxID=593909 RepID=A0ABV1Y9I4_9HYPH|nr:hypothetical protein [Mesorhizobium sp.]TIN97818.1 MAG: hypothetical protein E5Y06_02315 [Mesorhizobium sp.]TJV01342.1 MAG: hypothetical protein E5Y08_02175 [Mesorhizobium sp.]TJV19953.1 MAG: hypothetical protein E5Y07_01865 [Mesorhizobium sp.]